MGDRPRKREDMFGPEPKAAGCRWKRIEHAVRDSVFVQEHKKARKLMLAGHPPVFPAANHGDDPRLLALREEPILCPTG